MPTIEYGNKAVQEMHQALIKKMQRGGAEGEAAEKAYILAYKMRTNPEDARPRLMIASMLVNDMYKQN
jgi:hypothetical protein